MKNGFTLIELIVSIALVVILSSVVFASFRGGEERLSLQRSTYTLLQDLRRTEEMALSGMEQGGVMPQGGYGVYFSDWQNKQYILFADKNGDCKKDSGEEIEIVKLPEKIEIGGNSLRWNIMAVVFQPPDPTITICSAAGPSTQTQVGIFLRKKGDICPGDCKSVNVNVAGRIEIE